MHWYYTTTKTGTNVIELVYFHIFSNFLNQTYDCATSHVDSHATYALLDSTFSDEKSSYSIGGNVTAGAALIKTFKW